MTSTEKIATVSRTKPAKAGEAPGPAAVGIGVNRSTSGPATTSKLDQLTALLTTSAGATLKAMIAATGWQAHSVRGAMAGALKKRGLIITSDKADGVRIYRASVGA